MSPRSKTTPPIEEDDGDVQPLEPADLQFLTFTDFNQTTNPATKKKVRSHVMHRVQRNMRSGKGKGRGGEIVLDISSLSQADAGPSGYQSNSMLSSPSLPHPSGLGAGRSDPFVQYPIDMNVRTHELFDHLHGKTCPMFKTLSRIGFFRAVLDEAAFRQILCTSSSHMTRLREGTENAEAVVLSTEAIRSINRRISDPELCISDGVIITILAFACHAVMFNDVQGILTHFNGLEEIIRRRGGLQALRSNIVVRTVLFWVDVNTAYLYDRAPRFPLPDDILPTVNTQPFISLPDQTLLKACITDEMLSAVNELLVLIQFIASEQAVRDLWDDGVFAGFHIVPIISKFLSIRHDTSEWNSAIAREESCRIGALLYLAAIRHRFGVSLASDIYIPKLKRAIISQDNSNLEEIKAALLWVLMVGGAQSLMHKDHNWFVSATAGLIVRLQCSTWEEVTVIVRGVLWVEGILEIECDKFHIEVSSELWNSYTYILS